MRWGLQLGVALLPKSCKAERQQENIKVSDQLPSRPVNVLFQVWHFSLSPEDLALMDKLDKSEENQNTMAGWLREHDPDFY